MKRAVLLLLLMGPAIAWGQKTKFGEPYDTPVMVLVETSRLVNICVSEAQAPACGFTQELTVHMNRRELTVVGEGFQKSILKTGEYRGKLEEGPVAGSYETERHVELQLPDGKTRRYLVVGGDQ